MVVKMLPGDDVMNSERHKNTQLSQPPGHTRLESVQCCDVSGKDKVLSAQEVKLSHGHIRTHAHTHRNDFAHNYKETPLRLLKDSESCCTNKDRKSVV